MWTRYQRNPRRPPARTISIRSQHADKFREQEVAFCAQETQQGRCEGAGGNSAGGFAARGNFILILRPTIYRRDRGGPSSGRHSRQSPPPGRYNSRVTIRRLLASFIPSPGSRRPLRVYGADACLAPGFFRGCWWPLTGFFMMPSEATLPATTTIGTEDPYPWMNQ